MRKLLGSSTSGTPTVSSSSVSLEVKEQATPNPPDERGQHNDAPSLGLPAAAAAAAGGDGDGDGGGLSFRQDQESVLPQLQVSFLSQYSTEDMPVGPKRFFPTHSHDSFRHE